MKYKIIASFCLVMIVTFSSCKKGFLDKTPDGDLTIKDVFTNPIYSEQYLTNIYTHLPFDFRMVDPPPSGLIYNLFVGSTDELEMSYEPNFTNNINIGNWNPASGFNDVWGTCYIAIRKANLFLENIDQLAPSELASAARIDRWKGEALLLRAYYHFLLMRIYGPIPIIDKTIDLGGDLRAFTRRPIDECVDFVTNQCDEAMAKLEPKVTTTTDYGRPSKATCLALKARVLLYMASPLWNGGTTLANQDGTALFPAKDESRWQTAANAAKACIDQAETAGYKLYRSASNNPQRNYAEIFYVNFNDEVIWTRDDPEYQNIDTYSEPRGMTGAVWPLQTPTQDIVDDYQMANGTQPILGYNADRTPIINPLSGYSETGQVASETDDYVTGTRNMYVGREPRFYASIMFTGQKYKWLRPPQNRNTPLEFWKFGRDGRTANSIDNYSKTGYSMKKLMNPAFVMQPKSDPVRVAVTFRLGEQYLNYAEALNEAQGPVADVHKFVNLIRDRSGLPGLAGLSKDAMRDAIRHERRIELAFETHRYFDTHRWMTAEGIDNKNIYGLDVNGAIKEATGNEPAIPYNIASDAFYKRMPVEKRVFEKKHYFWPVPLREIESNPKLVQNPGW